MNRISRNFTMTEFGASPTAQQRGIDNSIPKAKQRNIRALVHAVLQPLRTSFGLPYVITSGYRSKELNRVIGGAANSQHLRGEAADGHILRNGVRIPTIEMLRRAIELDLPFDQAVMYDNKIHFAHTIDRENRRDVQYHSSYRGQRL